MPYPTDAERTAGKKGRSAYIERCVRTLKHEDPSKPINECLGKCFGMWSGGKKTESSKPKGGK